MTDLLEFGTVASSPLTERVLESRFVSVDDAQRNCEQVYHGSCSKRKAVVAFVALALFLITGFNLLNVHRMGICLILMSVAGIVYVVYALKRKQRVFIFEDSLAIERQFTSEVELIKWTDITKLYCVDRTTRIRSYFLFIPVATSEYHQRRMRMVLADGRQVVIGNRIRGFSEMANQIIVKTTAAQLVPCAQFLVEEGRTLDFDKFGLSIDGLVYKGKLIDWSAIQRVSLSRRGILSFQTGKWWGNPRFSLEAIPNASLLLEMLALLSIQCVHES